MTEKRNHAGTSQSDSRPEIVQSVFTQHDLIDLAKRGLDRRISGAGAPSDAYGQRLQTELAANDSAGCFGRLAVLASLVEFAERREILIGPGYGSSPSSLVLYALGITGIDPVVNKLVFERIDVAAPIVLQVESTRRHELIAFLNRLNDRDRHELSDIDVLGMNELSVLAFCECEIRDSTPLFRVNTIPRDDHATLDLFRRGETDHIALFGSAAMKRLLQTAQPTSFPDLCLLDAVYRPPFIGNGVTTEAARRIARGRFSTADDSETPAPEIAEAAEILDETYGVLVYQEQVMAVLAHLAGFSFQAAAAAVRVLSGAPGGDLDGLRARFLSGAATNEVTRHRAEKLFEFLLTRSPVTYNKAHCFASTTIAWQTAYCYVHHPDVFARALNAGAQVGKVSGMIDTYWRPK